MTNSTELGSIQRSLGRIEGKLDGINTRLLSGGIRMDKLETRVADNEKRVWRLAGAAGVVSALGVISIRMMPWAKLFA